MGDTAVGEGHRVQRPRRQLRLHRPAVEEGDAAARLHQLLDHVEITDLHHPAEVLHPVVALLQHPLQHVPGAGAGAAQQQGLPEQGVQRPGRGAGQGAVRPADAQELLQRPDDVVVLALAEVALYHREVQLPGVELLQQIAGVVHRHVELHVRVGLQIGRQPGRQQILPHRQGGPEAEGPPSLAEIRQLPLQLLLVVAHGEGRPAEQLPLRRQGEALAAVVQQPDAIVGLEVLDVLGHRRLGDVQLLRRPGIAAQAAYRQKGLHPKVLHALSPFSPSILHPVPGEKGEFCTGRRKCRASNLQDNLFILHFVQDPTL